MKHEVQVSFGDEKVVIEALIEKRLWRRMGLKLEDTKMFKDNQGFRSSSPLLN